MSTTLLNISASKLKHGNSWLARKNRLKRKKDGYGIEFDNELLNPESHPFGNSSVTNLWNENYELNKFYGGIKARRLARDKQGRWISPNNIL